jgi:hypothetical protein
VVEKSTCFLRCFWVPLRLHGSAEGSGTGPKRLVGQRAHSSPSNKALDFGSLPERPSAFERRVSGPALANGRGAHPFTLRVAGATIAALVAAFAVAMAVAASLYPGGTWCDPQAPGYDLWRSFFCDLLHTRGLNGLPNEGASFARAALVLIAAAFVPFWFALPFALKLGARRAMTVRAFGVVSATASLIVAVAPSDRFPQLHQAAVLSATSAGVAAALLALRGRRVTSGLARALPSLAWAALITAALDAGLYAAQLSDPAPCALALPALQKLAAALIVAWMLTTAWVVGHPVRGSPASSAPHPELPR